MSANTFGTLFRVTTFGESHGPGLGAVIDGCPAGVLFDFEVLQKNLNRRRPGQSSITTDRNETDEVNVISGVYEGRTLGTPIALWVQNKNADSRSYTAENLKMRQGHATDLWQIKFGHSDPRGSGRASGRETVSRVMAGSVAQMFLKQACPQLQVCAYVSQIGPIVLENTMDGDVTSEFVDRFETRLPDREKNQAAIALLNESKQQGDSYGGFIRLIVKGVPQGLGQPVFNKLKADMAHALLGIGATTTLNLGVSEADLSKSGKDFHQDHRVYGGIRGGLTTGEMLSFQLGFKPPATLENMAKQGRHDPCILPRAVAVVEAMAFLILADHFLWQRLDRIESHFFSP